MFTKISGNITILDPTQEVTDWLEENLILTNPVYTNLVRRGREDTIARKHVQPKIKIYNCKNGGYVVPMGCLYGLWSLIRKGEYETDFAPDHFTDFGRLPCNVDLFDYQERAVDALVKAKGGLLKAGCGSGKTYMGIEIARRLGRRFLWICGKKDLLRQTYKDIKNLYPTLDIGMITEGDVNMGKDGTIATVQTLINVDYKEYEDEFNVVITDEVHHVSADPQTRRQYALCIGRCKARYKYGLTATPSRQDGLTKSVYAYVGMSPKGTFRPTYEISDKDTQSLTSTYETYDLDTPSSYAYLNGDGSFDYTTLIGYLCHDTERTRLICDKVADLVKEGRKVAVLTLRVDNVLDMYKELIDKGVRASCVTGKSTNKQRDGSIRNPASWDVIVATVSLFKEGIDIKALDTVVLALPIKDNTGIIQARGRAERPLEGKKQPKFIYAFDKNIEYCVSAEKKIRRAVAKR